MTAVRMRVMQSSSGLSAELMRRLSNRRLVGYVKGSMIVIAFPDRETEKRALAFLLGRFSGCASRSGKHIVPELALEALADQNISFTVIGKADNLEARAKKGSRVAYDAVLAKVPDVEPEPYDKMPSEPSGELRPDGP